MAPSCIRHIDAHQWGESDRDRRRLPGLAAFLHVDCDLYQSTKAILAGLAERIVPGTVIVFDEHLNCPGWQNHKHKAFKELCGAQQVKYRYVSFAPTMISAPVVIESVGA